MFLYKGEVVNVWACRGFREVLMVQRAGLRLEWEGLNGRTPRVPVRRLVRATSEPSYGILH